jgi:hypothetical protein
MSELLKVRAEDLDYLMLTGAIEEKDGLVIIDPQGGFGGPLLQVPREAIKALVKTKEVARYSDGKERPVCFISIKKNTTVVRLEPIKVEEVLAPQVSGGKAYTYTVMANQKWQVTPAVVTGSSTSKVAVSYKCGLWTANPAQGMYDANGDPHNITAKGGYALPGAREGGLVGRIGDSGRPFYIGNGISGYAAPQFGNVELIINDDLDGIYGAGYKDNQGSVTVEITLYW